MQRPTSATAFGILNIAFAIFGVFGILATVAMFAIDIDPGNNLGLQIMEENAGYRMFVMLSIPLGAISIALLLSSGIGLLTVKPWGRKAAIGYALYAIAVGVVGMIANTMFLFLPLLEQAKTLQGAQAAGAIGGVIGGAVSGMLAFVYPVVLLIFMRRKVMVDAFSPARQVPSSLAEDQ